MHKPLLEEFELEDLPSDEVMSDEQLAEHALQHAQSEDSELQAQSDAEEDNYHENEAQFVESDQKSSEQHYQSPASNVEQTASQQFAKAIQFIKKDNNHYLGAKWFRKAAMQGHAKAQLYLGLMFLKGEGLPKSFFHAYSWLSLAACQEVVEAKAALQKLEPHLTAKETKAALKYAANLIESIHQ